MTTRPPTPQTILSAAPEADLLASLTQAATLHRLLTYHTKNSRQSPEGFPDLVIASPPTLFLWELKNEHHQPTPQQAAWLQALRSCTRIHAALIRPSQYDAALALLNLKPEPDALQITSDPATATRQ